MGEDLGRKDRRRRKGGRYTPPGGAYRADAVMTPGPAWMTRDPAESAAQEAAFFADGVTPEKVFVLFPAERPHGQVDSTMPPMLVAGVDEARWPTGLRRGISDLMAARSAHPDDEWLAVAEYGIGWSSIFRVGDPGQIVTAATKLKLDVKKPLRFRHSFIFDLTQVLQIIRPVVDGGIFALGTLDQVEYLTEPERTFADAIEMMPVFELPASGPLASIVARMEDAGF